VEYDETNPAASLGDVGIATMAAAARKLGVPIQPQGVLPPHATDEHFETLERRLRRYGSEGVNAFLRSQR
jgi:hypothetical protein